MVPTSGLQSLVLPHLTPFNTFKLFIRTKILPLCVAMMPLLRMCVLLLIGTNYSLPQLSTGSLPSARRAKQLTDLECTMNFSSAYRRIRLFSPSLLSTSLKALLLVSLNFLCPLSLRAQELCLSLHSSQMDCLGQSKSQTCSALSLLASSALKCLNPRRFSSFYRVVSLELVLIFGTLNVAF